MNEKNMTLLYYENNAKNFTQETQNVDFLQMQSRFINYLTKGNYILDLGCGAGRDSKYFKENGFNITAVDGSQNLCNIASKYIGQKVINSTFEAYNPKNEFDGIWACASLLHLDKINIVENINKFAKVLKTNGYFYMSFKYGEFSGVRNGRFFTDLTEKNFLSMMKSIKDLEVIEILITNDVRVNRKDEKWLNIFLKKIS